MIKKSALLLVGAIACSSFFAAAETFEYHHALKGLKKSGESSVTDPGVDAGTGGEVEEPAALDIGTIGYYRAYPNYDTPYRMSIVPAEVEADVEYFIDDYAKFTISSDHVLSLYLRGAAGFGTSGINGYVIQFDDKELVGVANNVGDRDWAYRTLSSGKTAATVHMGGYATTTNQDLGIPVVQARLIFAE